MRVISRAHGTPVVQLHQVVEDGYDHADLHRRAPGSFPLARQSNAQPQRSAEQESVRNQSDLVVENVGGAQVLIVARPGLGNLQEFLRAADMIALQAGFQAIGRFLGLKAFALPRERPIEAIRPGNRICLLLQKFPIAQIRA